MVATKKLQDTKFAVGEENGSLSLQDESVVL